MFECDFAHHILPLKRIPTHTMYCLSTELAAKAQAKASKGFSDSNKSWLKLMQGKLSDDEGDDDEEMMVCWLPTCNQWLVP